MRIQLTEVEVAEAALVGIFRRLQRIKLQHQDYTNPAKSTGWQRDIEGALGEMALAKALGKYWSRGSYKQSDVCGLEVRTTQHPRGKLILRGKDKPTAKYYLLRGLEGNYEICGWVMGSDVMIDKYLDDPTGKRPKAWFVPAGILNKM